MKIRNIVLIVVMFSLVTITSMAIVGIDLSYWYADSDVIEFWEDKSHSVYVHPYESDFSESKLKSFMDTAYSRWSSTTGISKSYTTSQTSADVQVLGLSRATATGAGVPGTAAAVGVNESTTLVAHGYHSSSTKNISKVTGKGILYYVWDSTTENLSDNDWSKLFIHEMGHIFGYIGHYNSDGIMKQGLNIITTTYPSVNNKNHLKQVY